MNTLLQPNTLCTSFALFCSLLFCGFLQAQVIDVTHYNSQPDDGYDDTVGIQMAINDANDGDTILIPSGQYEIQGTSGISLIGKTNLTIEGRGAVFVASDIAYESFYSANPLLRLSGHGHLIQGITFDGSALSSHNGTAIMAFDCSYCVFRDLRAEGFKGLAQFGEMKSSHSLWENNTANNSSASTPTRGFWFGNSAGGTDLRSKDIRVIDNTALNNSATGIVVFTQGALVQGNVAGENLGAGIITPGTDAHPGENQIISDNHMYNNLFWGYQTDVYAYADQHRPTRIQLQNNIIEGNLEGGVLINDANGFLLAGNTIINNGTTTSPNGKGVVISGEKTPSGSEHVLVTGNLIADNGAATQATGIVASSHQAKTIRHITISNNTIYGHRVHGIDTQTVASSSTVSDMHITDNRIYNNQSYGLFSAQNGTTEGWVVRSNILYGNQTRDIRLTGIDATEIVFDDNVYDGDNGLISFLP